MRSKQNDEVHRRLLPSKEPCFCVSYATIVLISTSKRRLANLHGKLRLEDVIFFSSACKNNQCKARFLALPEV